MTDFSDSNLMPSTPKNRRFWILAAGTIATIYMLILVGGIVRATGSGMGCPDWPTCFGQWIPPTSESQLPANYQQIYADRGYSETAFNVRKTWTEYLNRLLGVFTGFTILLTFLFSLSYRHRDIGVTYLAFAGFVLVGVQGWLGSRVVASNLHPGLITVHMLLAQVIVGIMIAAILRSAKTSLSQIKIGQLPKMAYTVLVISMILGLVQLVVGTQVREAIDLIAKQSNYINRHLWIDNLPMIFNIHKILAVPLLLINGWLVWQFLSRTQSALLSFLNWSLAALLLGTVVMGMSMDRLSLPIYAQPLHLWMASLIFGAQLAIFLVVRYARNGDSAAAIADAATDNKVAQIQH